MRSNSSSHQPMPMPRATRLPEIAAAVPTALATWNTLRMGSTYTLVKKRSRSVAAAIAPIDTHGSGQGVNGSQRRDPSGVYGYGVFSSSRLITWSETAMAW